MILLRQAVEPGESTRTTRLLPDEQVRSVVLSEAGHVVHEISVQVGRVHNRPIPVWNITRADLGHRVRRKCFAEGNPIARDYERSIARSGESGAYPLRYTCDAVPALLLR